MAEPLYQRLWAGQDWPMTDDDHEFLVPAFQRIGRALLPDLWEDQLPSINLWPSKPSKVEEASQEDRQLAHIFMLVHFRDRYQEDLEPGSEPVQPQFRMLGDLGHGASAFLGSGLGEQKRAPGYWFSAYDWNAFLAKLHSENEHRKTEIALVHQVARWLFNQVVRGSITPLVQPRKGGALTPSPEADWRMNTSELLRLRIQNCAMVPGHPEVPNGTHWIMFRKAEVDAALAQLSNGAALEQGEAVGLMGDALAQSAEDAAPLPGADLTHLDKLAAKQTYWRQNSEAIIRDALAFAADNGPATRKKNLFPFIIAKWPKLTESWITSKVWPKIVEAHPTLSSPGNRMGTKRPSGGSSIKKDLSA